MTNNIFETHINDLVKIDKLNLSHAQEAASMCFKRKDRFVEGYYHNKELISLINLYFGDLSVLYKNGLIKQFKLLKETVVSQNLIGLILTGINDKTLINIYTQNDRKTTFELTVSSITRTLVREHFTIDEINNLCITTPNFHIYYIKEDDEINSLNK
jgi:hypothetical protein